jgi:SAM-dependent methyltransferase
LSEVRFDADEVFDEDYLYFYAAVIDDERTEREVELVWRVLELEPGMEILDLACGHGRIANRLAARGARVTGLDASPFFLELARRDAEERGVEVEYVHGDMRSLPWRDRFARVLIWFTSFGYFADDENRRVLAQARRSLARGGRLAIDIHNRDAFTRIFRPADVVERDGDLMIDDRRFDVLGGRIETERIVVRAGRVRRMHFSVRTFTFTELRDWLGAAGFAEVTAVDHEGQPLTLEARRMLVVAQTEP